MADVQLAPPNLLQTYILQFMPGFGLCLLCQELRAIKEYQLTYLSSNNNTQVVVVQPAQVQMHASSAPSTQFDNPMIR